MQRRRELVEHGLEVDELGELGALRRLPGEQLEQRQILLDALPGRRPLDLDDHPLAGRHPRPVHLADRGGGERGGVDRLEHVLPRHPELRLHHRHDLFLGQRRDRVPEGGELVDELRRDQVRPGREDLPHLAEGRPELFQGPAQPPRLPPAALDRVVPLEERPQPRPGEDAGHVGAPAEDVGTGLLAVDTAPDPSPGSRLDGDGPVLLLGVDDDEGAAGGVGDPVRDVVEKELLAPLHARVAHHEHVGSGVLGLAHDRPGGVLVDHHPGAAALSGEILGLRLQLQRGVLRVDLV